MSQTPFPSVPILSTTEAHLLAFTLTSTYVGGLYLSRLPLLRPKRSPQPLKAASGKDTPLPDIIEATPTELDRDDPNVIKSRIRAVTVATVGGGLLLGGVVYVRGGAVDVGTAVCVYMSLCG